MSVNLADSIECWSSMVFDCNNLSSCCCYKATSLSCEQFSVVSSQRILSSSSVA